MIQLCMACKLYQIANKAQKGELPGHDTSQNIISNYSFGALPSKNILVYNSKGPQNSLMAINHLNIGQDITNHLVSAYKNHITDYQCASFKWLVCFLVLLVFSIIMLIVVAPFGAVLLILLILSPFFLLCYLRYLLNNYKKDLLPGLVKFCEQELIPKYITNNNIKVNILYPVSWDTTCTMNCDCGCFPVTEWITIRLTNGNLQGPSCNHLYWSNGISNNIITSQVNNNINNNNQIQIPVKVTPNNYSGENKNTSEIQPLKVPQIQELPPGWRSSRNEQGRIYYINDINKTTQWKHPSQNV